MTGKTVNDRDEQRQDGTPGPDGPDDVLEKARRVAAGLWTDAVFGRAVRFAFSPDRERRGEWSVVLPDVRQWDVAMCRAWVTAAGGCGPDDLDPWSLDAAALRRLAHEHGVEPPHVANEEALRRWVAGQISSGRVPGLAAWRHAAAEAVAAARDQFRPAEDAYWPLVRHGPDAAPVLQAWLCHVGPVRGMAGRVAVVAVDGRAALAVTTLKEDARWDLCRAYVIAGLLPPCALVAAADDGPPLLPPEPADVTVGDLAVVAAVLRTFSHAADVLQAASGRFVAETRSVAAGRLKDRRAADASGGTPPPAGPAGPA